MYGAELYIRFQMFITFIVLIFKLKLKLLTVLSVWRMEELARGWYFYVTLGFDEGEFQLYRH